MDRLLVDSIRFATFRVPFVIDSIIPGRPAALAGLQVGDSITHLNGKSVTFYDFKELITQARKANPDSCNMALTYVREGASHTIAIRPDSLGQVGVMQTFPPNRQLLPGCQNQIQLFRFDTCRC